MTGSYSQAIDVPVRPEEAFDAVAMRMSDWWTPMTDVFKRVGDQATANWPDGTSWSFQVREHEPAKRLVLYCYQADHIHPSISESMRTEWQGTSLVFAFEPASGGCRVTMTHEGLTPDLNCFEICSKGWDLFFAGSLKSYLHGPVGTT